MKGGRDRAPMEAPGERMGPGVGVGGRELEALRPRLPVAKPGARERRPGIAGALRMHGRGVASARLWRWASWDGKAGTGRGEEGDRGSRFSRVGGGKEAG